MRYLLIILICELFSCSDKAQSRLIGNGCINKSEPQYILPFSAGASYYLLQGNCGRHSHLNEDTYAYDFRMLVGTYVIAMRPGKAVNVRDQFKDGSNTNDSLNFIIILHDDSTASRYLHITQKGALVKRGQYVAAGDTIALSGNSGLSTEPHLHVDVTGYCTRAPVKPFLFHL